MLHKLQYFEEKTIMKKKKMKAYTLNNGNALVYTLDASIPNIANFIMSQPALTQTIVITDMKGNLVCSTMGQFLDRVPAQRLVPFFHRYLIPLQTGEKKAQITLPEPKPARVSDLEDFQMRNRPGAEDLSNYLFLGETELVFKSPHGYTTKLHLHVSAYENNGSMYVGLFNSKENEEWGDVTVNVTESAGLDPYCAAVKNYGENEGMEKFITKYELGSPTGIVFQSGFVSLPVYKFDANRLAMLSLNGIQEYEKARASDN